MEPPKVRAETWVQKEKYKNELQDALDMIIFDSEDPTGYLLADHCYKEKGNKEEAIEVFNMGLKHVSVTHNNDEALCQRKQEAGSRKAKRMDILGQLPREISNHIIGTYFDQESITPCSRVCSTWRNIILNHSEFWKRMTIGKPTLNSKVISPYHMLLPSICQYVQEIEIFNIINSRVTALFELFQTNNFSKIQSLKIRHSNYWTFQNPVLYGELPFVLDTIFKTLTTLDILFDAQGTKFPNLSDILNIDSNLMTLRYVVSSHYPVFIPVTITSQHKTLLKELTLSSTCKEDKLNNIETQKLLSHFSYLSRLAIGNCDNSIYTAIQKHGQNINSLSINHFELHDNHPIMDMSDNLNNNLLDNNTNGLKHIQVILDIASASSVLQLIKNHHHTLSSLLVYFEKTGRNNGSEWNNWTRVLYLFPLPNLTYLELGDPSTDTPVLSEFILPAIITTADSNNNQQILNLQSLKLNVKDTISNNVLDTVTVVSNLTELDLLNCNFDTNKMYEILNIFKKRSDNSTITAARTATRITTPSRASSSPLLIKLKICLLRSSRLNHDILLTISKIKSLVNLTIEYKDDNHDVFEAFTQNVAQSTVLENWKSLVLK